MGTHLQSNNEASRMRGRPKRPDISDDVPRPSKRRIVSAVFGLRSTSELGQQGEEIIEANNRGISLYEKGDFKRAAKLFQEAALVCSKIDAELPGTIVREAAANSNVIAESKPSGGHDMSAYGTLSASNYSYIYQRNEFDEGLTVYPDVEPIHKNDHPASVAATLLFNAGQAQRRLEEYSKAWKYYALSLSFVLPATVSAGFPFRISFNENSRTAHGIAISILYNMGQLAYRHGHLHQSISIYKVALDHCKMLRGPMHHSVGTALNCLGVLYYHLSSDESGKAVQYLINALAIFKASCGNNSRSVGTTLNNLGRVMVQRGDFDAASEYYKRSLEIRRNILGEDDLDFAATAFNAGQALQQMGEYDRAIKLYRLFLKVASKKLPKDHRDIAMVYSGIAQILHEREDYIEALKFHQKSLRVSRAAFGGRPSSETAMLLNRIGNFYFEREEFGKALNSYKEGLKVERKILEKDHPNICVTLQNIGEIYRQTAKYRKAIRYYSEALELQKDRNGATSAEVASAMHIIGLIFDQKGDSACALTYLQNALVLKRTVLGDDHSEVANTLTCLGTIFYRRGMVTTALNLFTESFRIRFAQKGSDDRDTAFILYNIGLCYQLQGSYKEAVSCFQETLRVEKIVLGENHKDVSLTLFKLGEAYSADGDLNDALECFRETLRIERDLKGKEEEVNLARTLSEVGNIHLARNEIDEMMKAFIESARLFRRMGMSIGAVAINPFLKLYAADFKPTAGAA